MQLADAQQQQSGRKASEQAETIKPFIINIKVPIQRHQTIHVRLADVTHHAMMAWW
jgi:hypothetical protein